jgi:HopA1 effector protein family
MSNSQQILVEIAEKIEIAQNLTVRHPDYPPLELEPEVINRFQQISSQLQAKYLTIRVQNYLYDIYFSHSLMSINEIAMATQQPPQIKNNTINGIDVDFYRQLEQSNPSHGYIDRDWKILAETDFGELIVVKDGLNLHLNRQQHLPKDLQGADIGDIVSIYLPHNLVGQDTYIIVGDFGSPDRARSIQVYFNFTPSAAISISQALTHELNQLGIPFQFAILHNPTLFHRYDCGTLWLPQTGYLAAQTVVTNIYRAHQSEFSANIPLFTRQLAPGLGIAEVPTILSSFGMQRCELLATGLLAAMDQGKTVAADKLGTIRQEFTTAGIEWLQPDLNPERIQPRHPS